jgi:hypothetical protein
MLKLRQIDLQRKTHIEEFGLCKDLKTETLLIKQNIQIE